MTATADPANLETLLAEQRAALAAWCPSSSLIPSRETRYHKVVSAAWLRQQREGRDGVSTPLLIEVIANSKRPPRDHIPGAIAFDTAEIEEAPMWNLVSSQRLKDVLASKGVRHDRQTIVYGGDLTAVARVIWTLMYAGVEDVRLLNGGLRDWKKIGGATTNDFHHPSPVAFGRPLPGNPQFLAHHSDVDPRTKESNTLVVSVRSRSEYLGKKSGYAYIKPKGRIPSAIWGNDGSSYWNSRTDRLKCPDEILAHWQAAEISPPRRVTFYCGTGWRSSLAFFYAYVLGFDDTANYDGSWLEWSSNPNNPIETGSPGPTPK